MSVACANAAVVLRCLENQADKVKLKTERAENQGN